MEFEEIGGHGRLQGFYPLILNVYLPVVKWIHLHSIDWAHVDFSV